jgi:hypothetical protein
MLFGWLTLTTLHGLDDHEKVKIHGLTPGEPEKP